MTDILSIVAVAGPFVGAGIGYIANGFLYRASFDYLRAERDEKEGEICSLKLKLISRNAQIVSLTSQLEAAGKPDQPRDPATGRFLPFPANDASLQAAG